jgi:lipopolysaccharide heptosyltransferase I
MKHGVPDRTVERLREYRPERIAIIKPSALGDVVQSLPVLAALREGHPHARITWVVNRGYAPLLRGIEELDDLIELDRGAFGRGVGPALRSTATLLGSLRRGRFDLVLDLQGLLRTGLMTLATGARWRIGLTSAREGSRFACHALVYDGPRETNAVERYLRVAAVLGLPIDRPRFPLSLTPAERSDAAGLIATLPRPILGVNAGARWETKRWPADSFAKVADRWQRERGGGVLILGGPGEERQAADVASGVRGPALNLCGRTSLRTLAALLEHCDRLLTNDTGPMHLAAAVGTSTFALYTCTSPIRASAWGSLSRSVQTDVACRSSYLKTCDRMDCMRQLTPELVGDAFLATIPVHHSPVRRSA